MHNLQCSTPSLTLNDGSTSSIAESAASGHSYNTRLSAKLRAKSRVSIGSETSLFKQHPIGDLNKNTVDIAALISKPLLINSNIERVSPICEDRIMPRYMQTLGCGNGCAQASCLEKFCRYLALVLSIAGMALISTYIIQNLQSKDGSYGCFNHELSKLKTEIANMKSEVQDVSTSKDDTEKKLEVIEELLRDLKRTTQKTSDTKKCLVQTNSQSKPTSKEIEDALKLYAEDKTGKKDFALESAGGSILEVRDTESFPTPEKVIFWGVTLCTKGHSANAMLQPGSLPGECWAFKGSRGCAVIRLLGNVLITGVSIEHISSSMSPSGDIRTAPKDFTIKGLTCVDDHNSKFLGKFTYEANGTRVQYFEVPNCERAFPIIEFKVLSNHGHPEFTCVYRLRVHGELQG